MLLTNWEREGKKGREGKKKENDECSLLREGREGGELT